MWSSVTPKLACSTGNTRRDMEERPVCFLASSRVSFVGLIRCVAHIHTGIRKAYSHWFMASGGQCCAGLLIDPNCILCRGRDFPAELFAHHGAPDFSLSDHISRYVHICVY